MTAPDPTMADLAAAVELGRAGERDAARRRLVAMWDDLGADGDALHRCSVAHFLADLQDDVREELLWTNGPCPLRRTSPTAARRSITPPSSYAGSSPRCS